MFGKRGLSAVVATVSLILLTSVAMVIIAGYIIPLVRNSLSEGTECTSYRDYFFFEEEFGYNCYKNVTDHWLYAVSVGAASISRDEENNIKGFRLSFITENGDSRTVDVEEGIPAGSKAGEIRKINASLTLLDIPKSGEVRTYVYNSSERFNSVRMAPKLKSERICPITDSMKINRNICDKVLSVV